MIIFIKSRLQILAENKKKKDEEFQETWRLMKQGKNRAFTEVGIPHILACNASKSLLTGWKHLDECP